MASSDSSRPNAWHAFATASARVAAMNSLGSLFGSYTSLPLCGGTDPAAITSPRRIG